MPKTPLEKAEAPRKVRAGLGLGTLGAAKRRIAELEEALSRTAVDIAWFNDVLKWTLNRCENTPLALLSLIREGAHKRFSDAVVRRGEQTDK